MIRRRPPKDTVDRVARLLDRCESIMSDAIEKYGATRLVMAPVNAGPVVSGTVVAVDLRPDEDVQWIWSHDPQRGSYVSGYTIVPRMAEDQVGRALSRYESQTPEEAVTQDEIAIRVEQLAKHAESHEVVLGILKTVCDLLKAPDESGA